MKYKPFYWTILARLMKKVMLGHYERDFVTAVVKKAKPIYRDMIAHAPDVGAGNPMAGNIYMSFAILAVWRAANGALSADALRTLTQELLALPIVQTFMGGGIDLNQPRDMEKTAAMFHRCADWLKAHPQYTAASWDFNFDNTKHRDGLYYHFTRCPIEHYCREHGLLDVLPVLCDIDYLTAKARHAVLYRQYTLAADGPMCDYWLVGDQVKDPK